MENEQLKKFKAALACIDINIDSLCTAEKIAKVYQAVDDSMNPVCVSDLLLIKSEVEEKYNPAPSPEDTTNLEVAGKD